MRTNETRKIRKKKKAPKHKAKKGSIDVDVDDDGFPVIDYAALDRFDPPPRLGVAVETLGGAADIDRYGALTSPFRPELRRMVAGK